MEDVNSVQPLKVIIVLNDSFIRLLELQNTQI